jgi:hypothetical protein
VPVAVKAVASNWMSSRTNLRGYLDLGIDFAPLELTYTIGSIVVPNPEELVIKLTSPWESVRQAAQGWIHGPAGSGGIYAWTSDGEQALKRAKGTAQCLKPTGHVISVSYDEADVIQARDGWDKFAVTTLQLRQCTVVEELAL